MQIRSISQKKKSEAEDTFAGGIEELKEEPETYKAKEEPRRTIGFHNTEEY